MSGRSGSWFSITASTWGCSGRASTRHPQSVDVERDRVLKAVASDGAAQGAKDVSGIVVGALDVGWFPVAAERDRAGPGPRPEVLASVLEVGMRSEPKPVGVQAPKEETGGGL